VWDFGSAARHHRLYAPWIPEKQSLAGMVGMRGAVSPKAGLFKQAAQEIKKILQDEGVAGMPLGIDVVEPPFLFALQQAPRLWSGAQDGADRGLGDDGLQDGVPPLGAGHGPGELADGRDAQVDRQLEQDPGLPGPAR